MNDDCEPHWQDFPSPEELEEMCRRAEKRITQQGATGCPARIETVTLTDEEYL